MNVLNCPDSTALGPAHASAEPPSGCTELRGGRVADGFGPFDLLTGLANRELLLTRLENSVKNHRQRRQSFALLAIDVDGFSSINDRFGRIAGDEVMRSIAGRLRSRLRGGDVAARYEDDAFAILIETVAGPTMILRIIERLQAVFSQPFFVKGAGIQVTATVGCALYPHDGLDANAVLRGAFEAMRQEKDRRPGMA